MDYVIDIFVLYLDYAKKVFGFLIDPKSRIYSLYLITSLIFAYAIYKFGASRMTGQPEGENNNTFVKFLFPKHVWSNPSAWLDVRYFFFNNLTGHFLLLGLMTGFLVWGYELGTWGGNLAEVTRVGDANAQWQEYAIGFVFMVVLIFFSDFWAYAVHYMQHKVPILWEFHRVHHSAEVMHPMSNFREHPIDNFFYLIIIGFGNGFCIGLANNFLGYVPTSPAVLGMPLLTFLFNVSGYNLRHSHVWLRWPGVWSKVFPSPAHHHVHHSRHPDHIDKNFAFMFPIWDVIFKTYEMPETNKDVEFGVDDGHEGELDSCLKLYFVPFKRAWALLSGRELQKGPDENQTPAE